LNRENLLRDRRLKGADKGHYRKVKKKLKNKEDTQTNGWGVEGRVGTGKNSHTGGRMPDSFHRIRVFFY